MTGKEGFLPTTGNCTRTGRKIIPKPEAMNAVRATSHRLLRALTPLSIYLHYAPVSCLGRGTMHVKRRTSHHLALCTPCLAPLFVALSTTSQLVPSFRPSDDMALSSLPDPPRLPSKEVRGRETSHERALPPTTLSGRALRRSLSREAVQPRTPLYY